MNPSMISNIQGLILGLVQGLTEFLPVSSSAHLAIAQKLMGLNEVPLWYDILLHVSTLLVTIFVFKETVLGLLKATLRLPLFLKNLFQKGHLAIGDDPQAWLVVLILLTTLITGVIGLLLKKRVEEAFSNIGLIGACLIITGFVLKWAQSKSTQKGKSPTSATLKDSAIIGVLQGLAVFPGISRSGTTISASLLRGFDRKFAGEYAFLISIPTVAGACIIALKDGFGDQSINLTPCLLGLATSLIAGFFSLKMMLTWIQKGKLTFFSIYCWVVGVSCIGWALAS